MGLIADLLLEALLIAVEFLDGQRTDDTPQVTGDGFLDRRLHVVDRHAEEALRRPPDMLDVSVNLDLGDRLDVDRNPLDGVDMREIDLQRHHPQREDLVLFPPRPDEGTAASDDPETLDFALFAADLPPQQFAPSEDDQGLVGTGLLVPGPHDDVGDEEEDRNDEQQQHDGLESHGCLHPEYRTLLSYRVPSYGARPEAR